jgi:hypothetical protein
MARILACPPSAVLSANLPENTNPKAQEGTRVHSVIENALRTRTLPQIYPWTTGDNLPDHLVVDRVNAYINQLGPGELLIEKRVKLYNNVWGTLDIGHIPSAPADFSNNAITVFDYKNGGFDVKAKDNKQLLTYAATFLDSHPHIQWYRLVVFQPNSWGAQGDDEAGFKQHIHARTEVETHRAEVSAAIQYTGAPRPGPHCRWCSAFPACPAMSQDAYFLMAAISRDRSSLSPNELLRMLRIIRAVSDMKDTLENYLTEALKAGAQVEGAELRPGTKWQQWNNEREAAIHLWNTFGPRGVKPLSVSQARKMGPAGEQYASMASHKPEAELKVRY